MGIKVEGPETEHTMTAQGEIECMDQIAKVLNVMPADSRERALRCCRCLLWMQTAQRTRGISAYSIWPDYGPEPRNTN